MFRKWLARIEEILDGGVARDRLVQRHLLEDAETVCILFDAMSDDSAALESGRADLVVVPAVWHRRAQLLAALVALAQKCQTQCGTRTELLLAYDEADSRLAPVCEALLAASALPEATLEVRRVGLTGCSPKP